MKKPAPAPSGGTAEVDAFMGKLKHPLKADIETVRGLVTGAAPAITEEVKWNSPGFRTTESFATVNLRSPGQLQLILHLGAKVRKDLPEMKIPDSSGLLKWLGKDRALVALGTGKALAANTAAFQKVIRAWIKYV